MNNMEKIENHKGVTWDLKSRISNFEFRAYDFTGTNFNSAMFENVSFNDCVFDKSILSGTKIFYDSNFSKCAFRNVDLSNTMVGSHKGVYEDCSFDRCSFKGKEFNYTRFISCLFNKCKLKSINFNASSFYKCKFIGSMDDLTFNGIYDSNKSEFKILDIVDFFDVEFGEFVSFINCDLSSCIPPKGKEFNQLLYNLYANDPSFLSTGSKDKIVLARK